MNMIVGPFVVTKGYTLFVIVIIQSFVTLRCYFTGRFATTSFSATQRCNVETMLQKFETSNVATIFQRCVKNRRCELVVV